MAAARSLPPAQDQEEEDGKEGGESREVLASHNQAAEQAGDGRNRKGQARWLQGLLGGRIGL